MHLSSSGLRNSSGLKYVGLKKIVFSCFSIFFQHSKLDRIIFGPFEHYGIRLLWEFINHNFFLFFLWPYHIACLIFSWIIEN